jgi:hypothetical protein
MKRAAADVELQPGAGPRPTPAGLKPRHDNYDAR